MKEGSLVLELDPNDVYPVHIDKNDLYKSGYVQIPYIPLIENLDTKKVKIEDLQKFKNEHIRGSIGVVLQNIMFFSGKEYDLVSWNVESIDCHAFNDMLSRSFFTKENEGRYVSHCPIALVKKGIGLKYANSSIPSQHVWTNRIVYYGKDGSREQWDQINPRQITRWTNESYSQDPFTELVKNSVDDTFKVWISKSTSQENLYYIDTIKSLDPGKGNARRNMEIINSLADQKGATLYLVPDDTWGSNIKRLIKFYKSLGYVENKGRNKDYSIGGMVGLSMYRRPIQKESMFKSPALFLEKLIYEKENEKEREELFSNWKKWINMSAGDIKKFMDSEEGKDAGLSKGEADREGIKSGRESATWLLKMIPKGGTYNQAKANWTPSMWEWAGRQVSFNSRMYGMRKRAKGNPWREEDGSPTRLLKSLKIWGHDPEK